MNFLCLGEPWPHLSIPGTQAVVQGAAGSRDSLPHLRDRCDGHFCFARMSRRTSHARLSDMRAAGVPAGVEVRFSWDDAFKPSQRQVSCSVHLEKSAVLFNMGAALTKLASEADRASPDGVNGAARNLQDAAGCFAHLRDQVAVKLDASSRPEDIGPSCCTMLEKLCLAQAQQVGPRAQLRSGRVPRILCERGCRRGAGLLRPSAAATGPRSRSPQCCYESAAMGGKKGGILARLAKQCADLFGEAEALAREGPLAKHLDKSWAAHALVKNKCVPGPRPVPRA